MLIYYGNVEIKPQNVHVATNNPISTELYIRVYLTGEQISFLLFK